MFDEIRERVYKANILLKESDLVTLTWGNVSEIDREKGVIVIKPSGVSYDDMKVEDMVVIDLDGNVLEGELNPSSDTPTHLELYKAFPNIKGIVHTHSTYATAFAQAGCAIPNIGTTHADYFYKDIPCTRAMVASEMDEYEKETGTVIIEAFKDKDPMAVPGVIVYKHGPFAWGKNPHEAVHNAVVMETVANMAYHAEMINPDHSPIEQYLLDKHYMRKHGPNAYYGQKKDA